MTKRPSRPPITVPATALFLVISLSSTATNSSVPHPSQPAPDLQEVESFHRVAGWVAGSSPLKALRAEDLRVALGEEEDRGFALFEREVEDDRERVLADLPFGEAIAEAARRHRVDGLLVAAVVETESSFRSRAVSPRGAKGLMQVMPATGERYDAGDLFDPDVNLDVGSRYLGSLVDLYDGDLELALAAYNAGPGTVARYGGVPPYRETHDYVERVLARYLDHHESLSEPPAAKLARRDPVPTPRRAAGRGSSTAMVLATAPQAAAPQTAVRQAAVAR